MKFPWSDMKGHARALTIFVVMLLVSSGLCGLQLAINDKIHSSGADQLLIVTGVLELIAMFASIVGIVIVLIVWTISSVINRYNKRSEDDDLTGT